MGQTLMGRPVSQRFDPNFASASFPTLTTASAAASPFFPQAMQPAQPGPTATIPKQIVPRTVGSTPMPMPRWGPSTGFRGSPLRNVNV